MTKLDDELDDQAVADRKAGGWMPGRERWVRSPDGRVGEIVTPGERAALARLEAPIDDRPPMAILISTRPVDWSPVARRILFTAEEIAADRHLSRGTS